MSGNICPRCHQPIRIPQEEVTVIKIGSGKKAQHRMIHNVCPSVQPETTIVGGAVGIAGLEYCASCGHAKSLHTVKCSYSSYGYKCDCKKFTTKI